MAVVQGQKKMGLKEAIRQLEESRVGTEETPLAEETEVKLIGLFIDKMDTSTTTIPKCEKFCLSTNMIERLSNLNALKCLRVLSVGRNYLKSLAGVETCAETLEEIWASYNQIEKPSKGVSACKKLRVLYLGSNWVREWSEVARLSECPALESIILLGNPLEERFINSGNSALDWQREIGKKIPHLRSVDGYILTDEQS